MVQHKLKHILLILLEITINYELTNMKHLTTVIYDCVHILSRNDR